MRRSYAVALTIVAILVGIGIAVGAYHVGVNHGLAETGHAGTVVRPYYGGPGWGFFPFGFLFFPLLIIGFFALARLLFWGGRWGDHGHPHPHAMGGWQGREAFEDWHRREHERGRPEEGPDPGERPTTV